MSSGNDSSQEDEIETKNDSVYELNSPQFHSNRRRRVTSTQPNVYTPLSLTSRRTESQINASNAEDANLSNTSKTENKFNGGLLKQNNSSRNAPVKNQRSSVRPFFCCGSELSLVSLVEGIDLKDEHQSNNSKLQSIECYSSSDDDAFELSPMRKKCNTLSAGDMSRHSTFRRKKKEKHVKKKKFWSLRLHSRWSPRWRSRRSQRSKSSRDFSQQSIASGCSSSCNGGGPSGFNGQAPNVRSISTATSPNQFLGLFNFFPAENIAEAARQRRTEEVALGIEFHAQAISRAFRSNVDVSGSMMDILRFRSRLSSTNSDILQSSESPIEDILMNNLFSQVQNSRGSVDSWRGLGPQVHTQIDYVHFLVPDLAKITSCSYYWGVMDRYEAERLLENKPPGTFLLRDSAQEDFLFSVSFRRYNRSLHARIEQWNHRFSFDAHDPNVFSASTVCELVEHYKDPSLCMFFEPMLTRPLHRTFPFSLQHMSRTVICDRIAYDDIQTLPIPNSFKKFLQTYHYKKKIRVRRFDIPEMASADSRVVP